MPVMRPYVEIDEVRVNTGYNQVPFPEPRGFVGVTFPEEPLEGPPIAGQSDRWYVYINQRGGRRVLMIFGPSESRGKVVNQITGNVPPENVIQTGTIRGGVNFDNFDNVRLQVAGGSLNIRTSVPVNPM